MSEIHTGGCLCGAVRFETHGEPSSVALCDCASCRRATGAAGVAWSSWHDARVTWNGRPMARFASSPGVERGFCAACGTSLVWRSSRAPDHTDLSVAAFDDPATFVPDRRIHCADRLPWQDREADLPRHAGWSNESNERHEA